MYFIDKIKNEYPNKKINLYIDMDGVITDYDFPNTHSYIDRRPILTNIKTIKELAKLDNVVIYVLSICKQNNQIKEKNIWLDKHLEFIPNNHRHIISKEEHPHKQSKELKCEYLQQLSTKKNEIIMLIDDDNEILKYIHQQNKNIILFQDSSIIE